ncbi:hypothetical protein ABTM45_18975, partial [Acinetobacter baumannii]
EDWNTLGWAQAVSGAAGAAARMFRQALALAPRDPEALTGLGELTQRYGDARGMLLVGKAALNRGLPFDFYAYPVNGIPQFTPIGPEVERSIVYAIARQESAFN